jgi:hypothetical protein
MVFNTIISNYQIKILVGPAILIDVMASLAWQMKQMCGWAAWLVLPAVQWLGICE